LAIKYRSVEILTSDLDKFCDSYKSAEGSTINPMVFEKISVIRYFYENLKSQPDQV